MSHAIIISKKEIKLLFKSKRRILLFFMVPIMLFVVAIFSVVIGVFFVITTTSEGPLTITIIDHAQDENSLYIINNLSKNNFLIDNKSEIASPNSLLSLEQPPSILIYFPENFSSLIENKNVTANFYVWYDNKDLKNEVAMEIISYYSSFLNQKVVTEEYGELNLKRVGFITQGTSSGLGAEEASSLIIIPLYMLIFFVVPPTTLILISITQEREQKTLESLLLQPIKRKTIVIGKILYGVFLVMSNLLFTLITISLLIIIVVYLLTEYVGINIIDLIIPLITLEVGLLIAYIFIGLTILSFLLISMAVFFSLIAKDEREGNMVISLLMIFPVLALIVIFSIPIHKFDLFGQIIITGFPIVGFLFAIYLSLLSGSLGIPAVTSLMFQSLFCLFMIWLSSKLIEMEGILDINLSQAFKRLFRRA